MQNYLLKGRSPSLLIIGGLHGDESETVSVTEQLVEKYYDSLPSFLFVPAASPSALKLGTRQNEEGVDLNRSFFQGTTVTEAKTLMELLVNYNFENILEIHEDPLLPDPILWDGDFYIYDGETKENFEKYNFEQSESWKKLKEDISSLGIKPFNGIDDVVNPGLGYLVKDGYVYWPMIEDDHSIDNWLIIKEKRAKHVICPEIPGKISIEKKTKIIDAIFRHLILGVR